MNPTMSRVRSLALIDARDNRNKCYGCCGVPNEECAAQAVALLSRHKPYIIVVFPCEKVPDQTRHSITAAATDVAIALATSVAPRNKM